MSAIREPEQRCPTCGKWVGIDPDGFYDTIPGGVDGCDYLAAYCDEDCAKRKNPPSVTEAEDERRATGSFAGVQIRSDSRVPADELWAVDANGNVVAKVPCPAPAQEAKQ